jgi:hypothetical protein
VFGVGVGALGLEGLDDEPFEGEPDDFPAAELDELFELLGLEGAFDGVGIRGAELSADGCLLSDGLATGAFDGAGLFSADFSACGGLAGGSAAIKRGIATLNTLKAASTFRILASFMILSPINNDTTPRPSTGPKSVQTGAVSRKAVCVPDAQFFFCERLR